MKFQPGQSGNPAGRPPGSLNKKTIAPKKASKACGVSLYFSVNSRNAEAAGEAGGPVDPALYFAC